MASSNSSQSTILKADLLLGECMKFIDFKLERLTPERVEGRFRVSEKSCQPFGVLHGGASALIAESLASAGAYAASGFQRIAGVELNINHLKAAPLGVEVLASAKPIHAGKKLHVWDVTFSKIDSSAEPASGQKPGGTKIAVARVTLVVGLSGEAIELDRHRKNYSRL